MTAPRFGKRRSRAIRAAVAAAVAAVLAGLTLASAQAGLVRTNATPIVPPDNRAYIFDTFGNQPDFLQSYASLHDVSSLLDNEGYRVITYRGAAATLANFAKMKGAGVIVLSTHGYDPGITHRAHGICEFGKGLFRTLTPAQVDKYDPQAGPYADEFESCHSTPLPAEPLLLVQVASSPAGAVRAYVNAREAGWSKDEIFPLDNPRAAAYGLALLGPGLARIFGSHPPTLVFASACYSDTFAHVFGADSYFGYHSTTYDCEDGREAKLVFDRLAGSKGIQYRDTASAWDAGGFGDDNFIAHIKIPVVLSPAVTSVSPEVPTPPAVNIPLGAGSATPVTLKFDANMGQEKPDSVLSVSGCDASISGASWQDEQTLDATLNIPKDAKDGEMTLTIDHAAAIGEKADDRNGELDGNQQPSPSSGVEPNGTDYSWTLPCEQKLYNVHLDYTGSFSDQYTAEHNGITSSSSETAQFDESANDSLEFLPPLSTTPSAPTLSVTGQLSSSAGFSCTIGPGDPSTLQLGIIGLLATVTSAGTTTKTGNVVAGFPPVTITGTPNNCAPENTQIAPADFFAPPQGGVYDPGGMLNAAQFTGGSVFNVNGLPFTQTFPFNYTETGTDGSTDHVSGSATLTVTLAP